MQKLSEDVNVFLRWGLMILLGAIMTPAFTNFFASLTIQIADAPNLAGLVVNQDVLNGVALTSALALLVFAVAPKFLPWAFLLVLPFSMVGTGWQIQDQYQGFRGSMSAADKAGKYLSENYSEEDLLRTFVMANTRFDATNIAIWADASKMDYELYVPGASVDTS
jgi:hypothetical protein